MKKKCVICNRTEEYIWKKIFVQISQIEEVLFNINRKIAETNDKIQNDSFKKMNPSIDLSVGCVQLNNNNCMICLKCKSIDDEGYFWCDYHKRCFILYNEIFELNKLKHEKKVLDDIIEYLQNLKFRNIEVNIKMHLCGKDNNYYDFEKIESKYNIQSNNLLDKSISICPFCEIMINEITESNTSKIVDQTLKLIDKIYKRK